MSGDHVRKLAGIEAYTPVDNVSELPARTNDEGWETVALRSSAHGTPEQMGEPHGARTGDGIGEGRG